MQFWLPPVFFLIALLYSMAGFAGGSSYIALLVLSGVAVQQIPLTALTCNLIVSCGGAIHFYLAGHARLSRLLPFLLLSVPMAFIGGSLHLSKEFFCLLLGFSLLAAAIRLAIPAPEPDEIKQPPVKKIWMVGVPLGAGLGFLSGLVGIGGGIFLSPVLLLLKWVNAKQAAAAASIFIFLNSLAGWLGHWQKGQTLSADLFILAIAVFAGGQIGSLWSARKLRMEWVRGGLVGLVFYAAAQLIWKAL